MTSKIVLYRCAKCGNAKETGATPWVREIVLACGGQLEAIHVLRAIEDGAIGVALAHCPVQACSTLDGAAAAVRRLDYARALLEEAGIGGHRVKGICFSENTNLQEELANFLEEIKKGKE